MDSVRSASTVLRVSPGISLGSVDPSSTPGFTGDKAAGEQALAEGSHELAELQERLFAESRYGGERSVLLVLQAMDTAGKGGILTHVFGGTNPQGISAFSFKAPTEEERKQDFLWRIRKRLPAAGYIGVFDRSHYEDVLIHRVRGFSPPETIEDRYGIINEFEHEVAAAGTTVVKVMLHISADEQKRRLAARLGDPTKQWKYNPGDLEERAFWPAYMEAYEIAINRTSTPAAPWHVVPANRKWYARIAVQALVLEALRSMNLEWPSAEYDVELEKRRLAESQVS
jgi:PPK2 family polyphosphate:nucleotide phosphotransferase